MAEQDFTGFYDTQPAAQSQGPNSSLWGVYTGASPQDFANFDPGAITIKPAFGKPGSPEMAQIEQLANEGMQNMVVGRPLTANQQAASYLLTQNGNYPRESATMKTLKKIADVAVPAILAYAGGQAFMAAAGSGAAAGAGAASAAPAASEGIAAGAGAGAAGGGAAGAGAAGASTGALGTGITAAPATGGLSSGLATTTAGQGLTAGGAALGGTGASTIGGGALGGGVGGAGVGVGTAGTALGSGFFGSEGALGAGAGGAGVAAPSEGGGSSLVSNQGGLGAMALKAAPSLLGMYASGQQSDAYQNLANQYMGMGEPYRQRLSDLYNDPSSFLNSAEVQVPVQQGTNILARSLSTKGNPFGSGNALQELQNYATNSMWNKLGEEKSRLGGLGGLSTYQAAAPGMSAQSINADRSFWDSLGAGMADVFGTGNKKLSLEDLYRMY